ncbi:MAG: hypothetical protein WCX63_06500 [Methanoregula sp.]
MMKIARTAPTKPARYGIHGLQTARSSRGGTVRVTLNGDRVILGGHAVQVFSGQLLV